MALDRKSRSVGQKRGDDEATGYASGRRIVDILRTRRGDLSTDDYAHPRKVVGYAKRHLAQRPSGDIDENAWRYSLMNWGTTRRSPEPGSISEVTGPTFGRPFGAEGKRPAAFVDSDSRCPIRFGVSSTKDAGK